MRHISRAIAGTAKANGPWTPSSREDYILLEGGIVNVSRVSWPVAAVWNGNGTARQQVNIYILPPELKTRDLITRYFSNTGLLFPYLHEQAFLETYDQMKNDNFKRVRRTWLGLLNMVLALATSTTVQSDLTAKIRAADSDVYYERALQLCEKQLMRGTSLEVGKWLVSWIRPVDEYLKWFQHLCSY